jgi:hypothetical protein
LTAHRPFPWIAFAKVKWFDYASSFGTELDWVAEDLVQG